MCDFFVQQVLKSESSRLRHGRIVRELNSDRNWLFFFNVRMVREQKMCERQWCLKHVLCVPVGIERQMSTRTKDQQHTVRTDTSACIRKKETHRSSISTPTFFSPPVCDCCMSLLFVVLLWRGRVFCWGCICFSLTLSTVSPLSLSCSFAFSNSLSCYCSCSCSFLVCIDTDIEAIDKNTKMYT